jgi:hypothetical protein
MTLHIVKTNVWCSFIIDSINDMIELAKEGQFTAEQELNGVTVRVNGDSSSDLIFRDQQRAQRGYITGIVGPYPAVDLTAEEIENDARIEAENELERVKIQEEYNRRAEDKEFEVKTKLANAPEIELADEESWVKTKEINSDGYGGGVLSFAERWARLMQIELANGKNLQDIADDTSSEADTEGITGFMYGAAVSILSKCWVHGETLRRWHNSKYQIGNEGDKANESGGVLNPAMLTID